MKTKLIPFLLLLLFLVASPPKAEAGIFSSIGGALKGAVAKILPKNPVSAWVDKVIDKGVSWAERKIEQPAKSAFAKVVNKVMGPAPTVEAAAGGPASGAGAAEWGSIDADMRLRVDNFQNEEGRADINRILLGGSRGEALTVKTDAELNAVRNGGYLGVNLVDLTEAEAGRVSVDLSGKLRDVNIAQDAELFLNNADLRRARGNIGLKMQGELNNLSVQRGSFRANEFTVNSPN